MAATEATVEIDAQLLREWPLPQPEAGADKEARGATLVIAGSAEMPGTATLAAISALRAGAGKIAVATPAGIAPGIALQLVEARVIAMAETEAGGIAADAMAKIESQLAKVDAVLIGPGLQDTPATRVIAMAETDAGGVAADAMAKIESQLAKVDAVLIGPGLQDAAATRAFTRRVLKKATRAAIVVDALAMDVVLDVRRFERTPLLTPHAGEMAHLTGLTREAVSADPERHARETALRWNAVVALKGSTTYIATPDGDCWRHAGGEAGLGTSGSGDVLAGIIVGLAGRGASLEQAAVWGVALHARAGQALAGRLGPIGYLARELSAEIPMLLDKLAH